MREYERMARAAVERLDVLEAEIPRANCSVRECHRHARYEWAGTFGTHWLCSRHWPAYKEHDRILLHIRKL